MQNGQHLTMPLHSPAAPSRLSKSKPQRSVSNMSQLTAQRVISEDPRSTGCPGKYPHGQDLHSSTTTATTGLRQAYLKLKQRLGSERGYHRHRHARIQEALLMGATVKEGPGGPWRELHPRTANVAVCDLPAAYLGPKSEPDSQSSCCCAPPGESKGDEADYERRTSPTLPRKSSKTRLSQARSRVRGWTQPMDPVSNRNQFGTEPPGRSRTIEHRLRHI